MTVIKFTQEEKQILVQQIQLYFKQELDQDIGSFATEFLLVKP